MKKLIFFSILALFLGFGPSPDKLFGDEFDQEIRDEFNEMLPPVFQNKAEALNKKCVFLPLKIKNKMNGICKGFLGNAMFVGVYDQQNNQSWKLKDVLRFPSWTQNGELDFSDLLGNGMVFIKTISDGNRGTGEYQSLLTYSGWNGKKFVPVFMETLTFDNNNGGEIRYRAICGFENLKSNRVVIRRDVKSESHLWLPDPKDDQNVLEASESEHWSESFEWNEKTFSFYDSELEKNKINLAKFGDQKNAGKMRLNFLRKRPDLYHLDYPDLDKLGIMM